MAATLTSLNSPQEFDHPNTSESTKPYISAMNATLLTIHFPLASSKMSKMSFAASGTVRQTADVEFINWSLFPSIGYRSLFSTLFSQGLSHLHRPRTDKHGLARNGTPCYALFVSTLGFRDSNSHSSVTSLHEKDSLRTQARLNIAQPRQQ